jgi:hypothetical protein
MAEEAEVIGSLKPINDYLDRLTNRIVDSKFTEYAIYRGCMMLDNLIGNLRFNEEGRLTISDDVELPERPKSQIYGLGKLFGRYFPKKKTKPLTKDLDFELSATEKMLEYLEEKFPRIERMVEGIIPDYNTFYKVCGIVSPIANLAVDVLEKPFSKLLEFSDLAGIFDRKIRGLK